MKNLAKLVGIIALVAVIGFSMTACDDGNGSGGGGGGGGGGGEGGTDGAKLLRLTIPAALVDQAGISIFGVDGKPLIVGAFKYGIFFAGTTPQQALAEIGYIAGNDGIWAADASYTQSGSNHILTLGLYGMNGDDWNGTGTFEVYVVMGLSSYYRVSSVVISSAITSITINASNAVQFP
jgi:hypothetical protein